MDPRARLRALTLELGRELLSMKEGDDVTLPSGETWQIAEVRQLSDELLQWAGGEDIA